MTGPGSGAGAPGVGGGLGAGHMTGPALLVERPVWAADWERGA
jgi:hypothetical protein